MIRIFNRFCRECQSDRPIKYYIHEWQKKFEHLFPFPYCDKCANRKKDIMLYDAWMAIVNAAKYVNNEKERMKEDELTKYLESVERFKVNVDLEDVLNESMADFDDDPVYDTIIGWIRRFPQYADLIFDYIECVILCEETSE